MQGDHLDNLYGDINTVSGIPWPLLTAEPKWYRLRLLNAASARPYLLRIRDGNGVDVSSSACQIVGGDGGLRRSPVPFPAGGLYMAVAERYDVVCNLRPYAGRTLFVWNMFDDDRMKDVPMFCNSHLVMRIEVAAQCNTVSQTGACGDWVESYIIVIWWNLIH